MIPRFVIAALALLLTTSALVAADEPSFRLGAITGDDVYVRSGAGDSYYPFGKVHRDDVVKIIGEKFTWARVVIVGPAFDEFFGYVTVAKLDTRYLAVEADGKRARVLEMLDVFAPNLNSKHNPDHSWKPIAKLKPGATIAILDRIETDRALVYKVPLPATAEGWISTNLVQDATPAQIQAWQAAVRKTAPETLAAAASKTPVTTPIAAKPPVVGRRPPVAPPAAPPSDAARVETTPPATPIERASAPALAREEVSIVIPEMNSVFEVDAVTGGDRPPAVETTLPPQLATSRTTVPDATPDLGPTPATPRTIVAEADPTTPPAPGTSLISTYYDEMKDARHRAEAQMSGSFASTPVPDVPAAVTPVEPSPAPSAETPAATPPAAARPAVKPRTLSFADAQRRLQDLESAYRRLKEEPIASAEVEPLRVLFETLEAEAADHESIAMYAAARAEQLSIWSDLQIRRRELNQLREQVSSTTRDAQQRIEAAMAGGAYVAVGRLRRSVIFDGNRMPVLYRLEDARSLRTVGYLHPDATLGLEAYVDRVIGVVGKQAADATLRVNVFTPSRIDLIGDHSSG